MGYAAHGPLSDPSERAHLFDDLPSLIAVVQGLLLHDHVGGLHDGTPPEAFWQQSRATLPVAERLTAIVAADPRPLTVTRSLRSRGSERVATFPSCSRRCCDTRAGLRGCAAALPTTLLPITSRTIGSASTGTRGRDAGPWPTLLISPP